MAKFFQVKWDLPKAVIFLEKILKAEDEYNYLFALKQLWPILLELWHFNKAIWVFTKLMELDEGNYLYYSNQLNFARIWKWISTKMWKQIKALKDSNMKGEWWRSKRRASRKVVWGWALKKKVIFYLSFPHRLESFPLDPQSSWGWQLSLSFPRRRESYYMR